MVVAMFFLVPVIPYVPDQSSLEATSEQTKISPKSHATAPGTGLLVYGSWYWASCRGLGFLSLALSPKLSRSPQPEVPFETPGALND